MRILHVCLAAFYIDNYSYQENLLPRMHKKQGHEVRILASTETFVDSINLGYIEPAEYINEDGIQVTRVPYSKWILQKIARKLRIYPGIYDYLESFSPELIFLHDVQFLSLEQVIKYAKKHPVRIIADGHADFLNSARTCLSKLLHKWIYRPMVKYAEPYIEHFYGTLPTRVEFIKKVYGVPDYKVSFLPLGADDDLMMKCINSNERKITRNKFGIAEDDFLIVTGGKIDLGKTQIFTLMETVHNIDNQELKLLVFGSVAKELRERFDLLCSDRVMYAGWASVYESYCYFSAADIVVFPSSHSVYWEQAAGMGKPLIVRFRDGITHMDFGGNVEFLYKSSAAEVHEIIERLLDAPDKFNHMKECAEKNSAFFSYMNIAQKAIKNE